MALAGCPDYFLRHPNYQESMDRTSSRRPDELIVPGFQHSANQNLPHHHDDDVDLEQLVNDMNSSMESVYSTQADTALLLNNGHMHTPHYHQQQHHHHAHAAYPGHGQQAHRRHTPPLHPSSPSREKLRHSQPMHIQAVRCLQEEQQQLRPASLPAIPNPFPELCSPAGSPVLSPIQTTDNHLQCVTSSNKKSIQEERFLDGQQAFIHPIKLLNKWVVLSSTIHLYTVVARLVMR
uniref:growth factor receptor-bound protein 10-like n=1 Tax=Solea senegalensis TaxID=28829 RepID=UPI001CD8A465|nr:growth factor receptor-bound protein 10-like [Solea senegalensis]